MRQIAPDAGVDIRTEARFDCYAANNRDGDFHRGERP